MKFMDKKEQVFDIQLTPYGEGLLSQGKFKPEYYSFFDDNVLYDSRYAGFTSSQNSVEPRIQEDTPQIATQCIYSNRDVHINKGIAWREVILTGPGIGGAVSSAGTIVPRPSPIGPTVGPPLAASSDPALAPGPGFGYTPPPVDPALADIVGPSYTIKEGVDLVMEIKEVYEQTPDNISDNIYERPHYGLKHPLGRSDILTQDAPAWSISMLRGEIDSSARVITGSNVPTINIPQINTKISFKTSVVKDERFISDYELAIEYPNGEFLDVRPDYVLAQIIERNAEFTKDNFDIEVFEVTSGSFGNNLLFGTIESLRPLKFRKQIDLVQNNILYDEDEINVDYQPLTRDYVEYYFDIKVDNEIDKQIICSSVDELKSKGKHVDVEIECEDVKNISLVDIYSTDALSDPCPDVEDPCEDKPGTIY